MKYNFTAFFEHASKEEIEKLRSLFWEYKWESVKEKLDSVFVISKILELGSPEQIKILEKAVGKKKIRNFLKEKGEKLLSPKSYNFWKNYYERKTSART